MQLVEPSASGTGLRRNLAAAVFALLGSSLAQADSSAPAEPFKVDPRLLGPGESSSPSPYSNDERVTSDISRRVLPVDAPVGLTEQQQQASSQVDSALLLYKENGGRVQSAEAVVHLKQDYGDERSLNFKLTFDALTGGSPNGALPSKAVQTFATPSGSTLQAPTASPAPPQTYTTPSGNVVTQSSGSGASSVYNVAAGQQPLDKSFHDERLALGLNWAQPVWASGKLSLGGDFSHELDFQSLSLNGAIAQDFNNKNTTLSLGANVEHDAIKPIGGAPVPMSDYALFIKDGNKSKNVNDLLLGATQVMNRRWVTQLNYSLDRSNGYQNDPYKILSAIDTDGNTIGYVYENRPMSRSRRSIYWGNKFAFDHDVLDVSYRRMSDDWGIRSDTVDLRYRWALPDGAYIEPHARWYSQSAADFHRFFLMQGDPLVPYASADPRLAKFNAVTLGVKLGVEFARNSEFNVRIEGYEQKGDGPAVVPTQLQGLDLYPGLRALILQAGLRFEY